jgi:hypothetical protein
MHLLTKHLLTNMSMSIAQQRNVMVVTLMLVFLEVFVSGLLFTTRYLPVLSLRSSSHSQLPCWVASYDELLDFSRPLDKFLTHRIADQLSLYSSSLVLNADNRHQDEDLLFPRNWGSNELESGTSEFIFSYNNLSKFSMVGSSSTVIDQFAIPLLVSRWLEQVYFEKVCTTSQYFHNNTGAYEEFRLWFEKFTTNPIPRAKQQHAEVGGFSVFLNNFSIEGLICI